jgi:hypothetical protein
MENKWLSRKLILAVVVDALAVFAAFGGYITPEQTATVVSLITSVYMVANAVGKFTKK